MGKWGENKAQVFEVTLTAFVEVAFDHKPARQELGVALLENALEYIETIRDLDSPENIVNDLTSVGIRWTFNDSHLL